MGGWYDSVASNPTTPPFFLFLYTEGGKGGGGKAAKIVAPVNICSFPSLSLSVEKGTCCDVGIPLPPPPAVRHSGSSNIDISQQGEEELEEGRG